MCNARLYTLVPQKHSFLYFFRDVIVVKGVNYGDFVFFGVKMGILWAKGHFCRHFVALDLAVYSLFFYALCVCRCDGTEPFRVGTRIGEVEFKTIQKDPHPRNLEQGSIVILLEYLFLSDLG